MAEAWMVRAGRDGERETDALEQSLIIAGWPEMDDLSQFATRLDLRRAVRAAYGSRSRTVTANWTGQLWRLSHVIEIGDLVVVPLKTVPDHVAVGRVTGEYVYRRDAAPDRRHVRPVQWIHRALPRTAIQQDLLYSLGSLLTICQLRRNGAARRIGVIAETGVDPGPTPDELSTDEWVTPDAFIAGAVAAEPGLEMTIRELLAAWGAARRTSGAVAVIEHDLAENGLSTVPPFTEGWIGNTIRLVKSGAEADDSTQETPAERQVEDQQGETAADEEMGDDLVADKPFTLRFGNLLRSDSLTSVRSSDSIALAQTLMLRHNYSQLAVIDEDGTFRGAISWESIARTSMQRPDAKTVLEATQVATVAEHAELALPRIDEISSRSFIFVRSADGRRVSGIITAADLTLRFGEIAKPFTMIEECERRLNRRVAARISDEIILESTNKRYKTAAGLTFGGYPFVLKEEKHFELLAWPLDHGQFVDQIRRVAKIRNRMMHFSPDPIPTDEWGVIDGLLAMLQAVDPLP